MQEKFNKIFKKIFSQKWDAVTLHCLFLFSLIFVFFLFASSFFFIGEKLNQENYEVLSVKIPSLLERHIKKMVSGSPINEMAPLIAGKDKEVAAYLVAIAKKESNWGKYSPKKYGQECYNYWGYRGSYNRTNSGYSCFDSPGQAVDVVGGRLEELINDNIDTPSKMIVWKCGNDCTSHDPVSAEKWINDVGYYYRKIAD